MCADFRLLIRQKLPHRATRIFLRYWARIARSNASCPGDQQGGGALPMHHPNPRNQRSKNVTYPLASYDSYPCKVGNGVTTKPHHTPSERTTHRHTIFINGVGHVGGVWAVFRPKSDLPKYSIRSEGRVTFIGTPPPPTRPG